MPRRAPTPCRHPACALVLDKPGYCDQHRTQVHRDYGRARRGFDSEVGFYQSVRWREVRAAFLRAHLLCVACKGTGLVVAAKVADHIRPLKDGGERFDWVNLRGLCDSCHNRKTVCERATGRTLLPVMPLRQEIEAGLLWASEIVDPPLERVLAICWSRHIPVSSASQAVIQLTQMLVAQLCAEGQWVGGRLVSEQPND